MPTLDWLNRDAAFHTADQVPYRLLQAVSTHGDGDARNLLVQGDNLEVVAELHDGRLLVVEYKGEPYATNDDSAEKRATGQAWARASGGRGLFLMAEKRLDGLDLAAQLQRVVALPAGAAV